MKKFEDPIKNAVPVVKDAWETKPRTKSGYWLRVVASAIGLGVTYYLFWRH